MWLCGGRKDTDWRLENTSSPHCNNEAERRLETHTTAVGPRRGSDAFSSQMSVCTRRCPTGHHASASASPPAAAATCRRRLLLLPPLERPDRAAEHLAFSSNEMEQKKAWLLQKRNAARMSEKISKRVQDAIDGIMRNDPTMTSANLIGE